MKGNGEVAAQQLNSALTDFAKGERFPGAEWSQISTDIFQTEYQNSICDTEIKRTVCPTQHLKWEIGMI